MPQCLARMDECMDNSCKQRAEYLRHSLVIVHTEHDQWQASFIWENLACCAEGGWCNGADFMKISKIQEILGELSMRKQCLPGSFFSTHAQEPGNEAKVLTNGF